MPLPFSHDDGHGFEVEPHRVRYTDPNVGLRAIMRLARMEKKPAAKPGRPSKPYMQRCAAQLRYTKGGSAGKWYSHGAYIARAAENGLGFSADRDDIPVAQTVAGWRRHGDELFFRLILSPEQGERLDMERHTRETMERVAEDLGTRLDWAAVIHRNTDNPHVHVVLRGVRDDGSQLWIPPEYVKEGIRARAEECATNQLGFRLEADILRAQRREVDQMRWTGLDRQIMKRATQEVNFYSVRVDPAASATEFHLERRLHKLQQIGLARQRGNEWVIDIDAEKSLRTMQKTHDRLKITAEFGVMASDPRLPFKVVRPSQIDRIEGRVLVHAQDEWSGNNFMLLESISGEVLRVPQVSEIAKLRQAGRLTPGHYMVLNRVPGVEGKRSTYTVDDQGAAELLTSSEAFLAANAQRMANSIPDGWGGWLGQMRRAAVAKSQTRDRSEDRGR